MNSDELPENLPLTERPLRVLLRVLSDDIPGERMRRCYTLAETFFIQKIGRPYDRHRDYVHDPAVIYKPNTKCFVLIDCSVENAGSQEIPILSYRVRYNGQTQAHFKIAHFRGIRRYTDHYPWGANLTENPNLTFEQVDQNEQKETIREQTNVPEHQVEVPETEGRGGVSTESQPMPGQGLISREEKKEGTEECSVPEGAGAPEDEKKEGKEDSADPELTETSNPDRQVENQENT